MGKIITWLTVTLLLVALLVYCLGGFGNMVIHLGINTYTYDDGMAYSAASSFTVDSIKELDIDWIRGNIKVLLHEGELFEISESAQEDSDEALMLHYRLDGSKLVIKYAEDGVRIPSDLSKDITILIPSDAAPLLSFSSETVSSSVEMQGVRINDVEGDSVSGSFTFTDCTVNAYDLSSTSGSVYINGIFEDVECETVSGNIKLLNQAAESLKIGIVCESVSGGISIASDKFADGNITLDTVSGDCTVECSEFLNGFTARFDTVSGDISCEYPTNDSDKKHLNGDGKFKIAVNTVSGDLKINKVAE